MNKAESTLGDIEYKREQCRPGIVHVGVGAFHRAHQAVYINELLHNEKSQSWGIVGINLRSQESNVFSKLSDQDHIYTLKTMSSTGAVDYKRIGSILETYDWSAAPEAAAQIVANPDIHMVSMTVTESGYYLLEDSSLDLSNEQVSHGLNGSGSCIYTYLRAALNARRAVGDQPITLLSCDNLRHNGKVLKSGLEQFLKACDDHALLEWMSTHVTFPCCMVDRITPRIDSKHAAEVQQKFGVNDELTVMAEPFKQWVIEDNFAGVKPPLESVGVEFVKDVEPYEDAKIRLLNAGHTIVVYMGALKGYQAFDEVIKDPELEALFLNYETDEAIPAITDSPIDLYTYRDTIKERFANANIGDSVERISADGASKFPIFVLVTIEAAYARGEVPKSALTAIASWYVFMMHVCKDKIPFKYIEPKWSLLEPLLDGKSEREFANESILWGELPENHPEFVGHLLDAIESMQQRFPTS